MKLLKRIFLVVLVLVLLAAAAGAYALFVEPRLLTVREYGPKTGLPLRIVQFSDTHVGKDYTVEQLERLVERLNLQEPDVVVFTGDLFDNYAQNGPREGVQNALAAIEAPYGKFAVWGNHDWGGGAARIYADLMAGAGFTLLTNETEKIVLEDGRTLLIGGLDDAMMGNADVDELAAQMEQNADYRLLLIHEPDLLDDFPAGTADLVLSGHSHGGQVWLPFGWAVTPPLAEKYVRGFYETGGMELYVSSGVGTSILPVRLGIPPEIAVFQPAAE